MGKMLTAREAADRMGLSDKKVYAMVASGILPGYKIGGAVRVDEEDLTEYLASCRIRPPAPEPAEITRKRRQKLREDEAAGEEYTGLHCLARFRA